MVPALLDVNVLLALAWPAHVHHAAAHHWFQQNYQQGWATCPVTQMGFVRLSMQPAVVKTLVLFGDVMDVLDRMIASPDHRFWPLTAGLTEIRGEIRARIMGHHQLADAVLLDLAIRHEGRLATFDRKMMGLLPLDSVLRDSVELIPV